MTECALYLESGPRRRKTMVHALDLLGCTEQGTMTEAAPEATPDAIRAYLRFLRRHGELAERDDAITAESARTLVETILAVLDRAEARGLLKRPA